MNGRGRLLAAACSGDWSVSDDPVSKMMRVQTFVSDERDLLIEVMYSGYTVKGARLWDLADEVDVPVQELTAADRGKAGRIEGVLLGGCSRF